MAISIVFAITFHNGCCTAFSTNKPQRKNTSHNLHLILPQQMSKAIKEAVVKPAKVGMCSAIMLSSILLSPPNFASESLFLPPVVHAAVPIEQDIGADARIVGTKAITRNLNRDLRLDIESFHDPKVQGVTIYLSRQSTRTASISCAVTGKIKVAPDILAGEDDVNNGELVYRKVFVNERRANFVPLAPTYVVVQRFYDAVEHVIIYDAYHLRSYTYDGVYKDEIPSSVCTLPLPVDALK